MEVKVLRVENVTLTFTWSEPSAFLVVARGTVPTSGWRGGKLVPRMYSAPPEDGVLDFDFLAEAPEDLVAQILSPIQSAPVLMYPPKWAKGVRVIASTNQLVTFAGTVSAGNDEESQTMQLASETKFAEDTAGVSPTGGPGIFPWSVRNAQVLTWGGSAQGGVDLFPFQSKSDGVMEDVVHLDGGDPTCLSGVVTALSGVGYCMDGATHQVHTIGPAPVRLRGMTEEVKIALDRATAANQKVSVCGLWLNGPECNILYVFTVSEVPGGKLGQYCVIALTAGLPGYQKCQLVPDGAIIPMIYSVVYGVASKEDCNRWIAEKCGR